jgi:hypothetical protein
MSRHDAVAAPRPPQAPPSLKLSALASAVVSAPSSAAATAPAPRATSAAAAALASRMADPAIGGRLARTRRPNRPVSPAAPTPRLSAAAAAMTGGALVQLQPLETPLLAASTYGAACPSPHVPVPEKLEPGVPPSKTVAPLNLVPVGAASLSLHFGGVVRLGLGPRSRTRMLAPTRSWPR